MRSFNERRVTALAGTWSRMALVLGLGLLVSGALGELAAQKATSGRPASSPFNLSAGAIIKLESNLITCSVNNTGEVCVDPGGSPTVPGGFWPTGTTNAYIFNSGIQVAAVLGDDAGPWAGDTTGAFFFDPRGNQQHSTPLTDVYDSRNPADIANWPQEAYIRDPEIYNEQLIGQPVISDHDTWVKYWDGDPNASANRVHPLGVMVEQRSLTFNSPSGAENVLFLIYKFTNVTNDPQFQQLNEQKFGIQLPDEGYTFNQVYAAFAMDPDVTDDAQANFATAILPFNLGLAYKGDFVAPDFNYAVRPSMYLSPFFPGPGIIGVKYLRSPVDPQTGEEVGLTLFSNTLNITTGFPDPLGDKQLWRYLSGNISTALGDNPCNQPDPKVNRLCFLYQQQVDTRFFQSSGPFTLGPGESATIVTAYIFGPPVHAAGWNPGTAVPPGVPSMTPGRNGQPIRLIEQIAGWASSPDLEPDGTMDQTKVGVVPGSLLANSLVAQSIFNNKFLLPRPPASPEFALVPGDGQVSIIWQPSLTEDTQAGGDPYAVVALDQDPNNQLYDSNYRKYDVEGYRIYRAVGLTGDLERIAEYDYAGTQILDYTGQFDGRYIPEEGQSYEDFLTALGEDYPKAVPLNGAVVQYPTGGRIRDAVSGAIVVVKADTVKLSDTGVPFVFVDKGLRNGVTYRYTVTAYDYNSLKSGVSTQSSPAVTKLVIPRAAASDLAAGAYTVELRGGNTVLDPDADWPAVDPEDGTFAGPIPATNAFELALSAYVPEMVGEFGTVTVRLDSITPGNPFAGMPATYYFTKEGPGGTVQFTTNLTIGYFNDSEHNKGEVTFPILSADPAFADQHRLDTAKAKVAASVTVTAPDHYYQAGMARGAANSVWDQWNGPRWFVSGQGEPADPNAGLGVVYFGAGTVVPDGHLAGSLPGVEIFPVKAYLTVASSTRDEEAVFSTVRRAADIKVTWGQNGQVTVHDVTHNVPVPFSPAIRASYGFLTPASFADVPVAPTADDNHGVITGSDFHCVAPLNEFALAGEMESASCKSPVPAVLQQNAEIVPVARTLADASAPENGFAMYINGEVFIFVTDQLPAAGTEWTLRTYTGALNATLVTAGGVNTGLTDYSFTGSVRPPNVPGLAAVVTFSDSQIEEATEADLEKVHTVPDPYYVRSAYDLGSGIKRLQFVNLPHQAIIRIYSANGTLVDVLEHNDPSGGGMVEWDLRNRNDQFVATGVYFYVVEAPNGERVVKRFTVIQFAR